MIEDHESVSIPPKTNRFHFPFAVYIHFSYEYPTDLGSGVDGDQESGHAGVFPAELVRTSADGCGDAPEAPAELEEVRRGQRRCGDLS